MAPKLQHNKVGESIKGGHICGACHQSFTSEDAYLSHVCPETDHKPTEIEHQDGLTGGNFSKIAEASLARGDKRVGEKAHPAEANQKKAGKKG